MTEFFITNTDLPKWLRRRFQNGYQHKALREKRLCCRTLTNMVKKDFLSGTKTDRTNQLPSTFMEFVGLRGSADGGRRKKCLLKKKNRRRRIPWLVWPYPFICDPLLALGYKHMFLLNWRNIQWPGSTMWKQAWLLFTAWCKWMT